MNRILFTLSCLFFSSIQTGVKEIEGPNNLDTALNTSTKIVIKFYKPGCPACRQIEQDYLRISNQFPDITFLAIDTSKNANSTIFPAWDVKGVPTFFFIKDGIRTRINRERNFASTFISSLKKHFNN